MHSQDVLLAPLVTEKATALQEKQHKISFKVALGATKHQIRNAVETLYSVHVEAVRTRIAPGKLKRRGNSVGRRPHTKKAVITLKKGETIDFYQAE